MKLLDKIARFYKNLSIKYKLLLVFYIQIIIPLIFMGFMFYQKSSTTIKNKSITYSQDVLNMIQIRVNDFIDNLSNISQDILYERLIYDVLEDSEKEERSIYLEKVVELKEFLRKTTLSNQEQIKSMCLISNDGEIYPFDINSKISIRDAIPYEDVLQAAKNARGKPIWYLDTDNKKVENIFLARTVSSKESYQDIGLLAIMVNKEFLSSAYDNLSTNTIENIVFLSKDNSIIVSRKDEDLEFLESFWEKKSNQLIGHYIDQEEKILVSYTTLDKPEWEVVANISLAALYKELDDFRKWSILLIISTLLILSILSVLTAIDIIEPIHCLVEGMKKMEHEQDHQDICLDRYDELGFLSQSFNKMSGRINYLVHDIYREQITRKEAELKALQAQINPHFLFNTLEMINWTARLNGVGEISDMVSALSSLMEASIGRDNKLISIKEEFIYIDNYIFILKSRYGNRLQVAKEMDDELLDMCIPKLLIQPLVENAIYHGVDKSRKTVEISLSAHRDEENVYIEIKDSGSGMTEEEVKSLNEKFSRNSNTYFDEIQNTKRKSIGLDNVNTRIKLFYGEKYGLHIESEYGKFTKVLITIPYIEKGEEGCVQSSYSG